MISIPSTTGAAVLSTMLVASLVLAGCGGGDDGDNGPETSKPEVMEPETDSSDMTDFGEWEIVRGAGVSVGYEHTGYDLMANLMQGVRTQQSQLPHQCISPRSREHGLDHGPLAIRL